MRWQLRGDSDGTARSTRLNDAPFGAAKRATLGTKFLTLGFVSRPAQLPIGYSRNRMWERCNKRLLILFFWEQ